MSKRLYEIARDLGVSSNDLSKRIEGLTLSFEIADHAIILDEEQVEELTKALQSNPPEERVQRRVGSGLIRRRAKRSSEKDESAAPASSESAVEAATPSADEPVTESAPEAPAEPARPRQRMATVVTRPTEDVEPPAAAAQPVEASTDGVETPEEAAEPAPRRSRYATVVTREVEAVAPEAPEDEPARPRSRFATVVTTNEPRTNATTPSANELAAFRTEQTREPSRGGAKVVGTLNPELLSNRLEADKKDFGPRRPDDDRTRGRDKKKGKRVVQSRDLYDASNRGGRGRKQKASSPQQTQITQAAEHKRVVRMEESILVGELAHQMSVKAGELAMKLMFDLQIKGANINTAIDFDTAQLVAEMYNFKIEQVGFDLEKYLPVVEEDEAKEITRPPVVTVMGHVDHGKTSLLDAIRSESVASGEAGGITQHIGAYQVDVDGGERITFLDTPGHEAFTALRARGAKATDIAILVVAADDGVMPQTVEAINHAKDAQVPIIVAVNKCDKENANPERVRKAMADYELIPEEWGGETIFVNVSALTQEGIPALLEMIHLQAEVLDLKARPDVPANGLVIESKLDVGRGPVATVLVQRGTLNRGDIVVVGEYFGRVRTMIDAAGASLDAAGPSVPVEVTGLNGVPSAGEKFHVVEDVDSAKVIAEHIAKQTRQSELALSAAAGGADALGNFMRSGELKELKIIVKGDVQGSVEAVVGALQKLATDKVSVRIIHSAVGGITESDVNLAASSEEGVRAVIVGFNVRADQRSNALADQFGVTLMLSSIIYEIIDRIRAAMTGMLEPVFVEEVVGHAEVRQTFSVPRVGTVAGCMVTDGVIVRNAHVRLMRAGKVVVDSTIGSLKHFEKNVPEVKAGYECGLSVDRHDDVQIGDVIECYKLVETAAVL